MHRHIAAEVPLLTCVAWVFPAKAKAVVGEESVVGLVSCVVMRGLSGDGVLSTDGSRLLMASCLQSNDGVLSARSVGVGLKAAAI